MSNDFTKEEKVLWEDYGAAFEDALSMTNKVSKLTVSSASLERAGDVVWEPQPYIALSYDGMDQTGNFQSMTQLAVPATLGFEKVVPWIMNAREARDAVQNKTFGETARNRIASDINRAVLDVACNQGSLVVPVATAAGDYDDIALCDSMMNEQGIPMLDRYLCLSSRDYNGMASNLAVATRSFGNKKSEQAYEKGYVGEVANFMTSKMDYANRIAAAGGGAGLTIDNRTSAVNYHTPKAKQAATTGERSNYDNRFQTITISSTASVAAGDAFTVAGIYAVHHETKQSTGELKTFRVISVPNSTTLVITPAIVSGQGGTDAELQYKNCVVSTESATAAIVFLNTTAANINPFWYKDSICLVPGHYQVEAGSGVGVLKATTIQGIEIVMTKFFNNKTYKYEYRLDALYGVVNKAPEMSGILIFGQV